MNWIDLERPSSSRLSLEAKIVEDDGGTEHMCIYDPSDEDTRWIAGRSVTVRQ